MKKVILFLLSLGYVLNSCSQQAGTFKNPSFVQDRNAVFEPPTIILKPSITWTSGKLVITASGDLGVINGTGTLDIFKGCGQITGDVTTDGNGMCVYSNVKTNTITCGTVIGNCRWNDGVILGIISNGHAIGVISGTGHFNFFTACGQVECDVLAYGNGECVYSNVKTDRITCGPVIGNCSWNTGAILGITSNGHAIGVISGTGKFELNLYEDNKVVTGDVTADGKGGCIYSSVKNDTIKSEYWDGVRLWKAGTILGITDKGKAIGVLSGTGKLDYQASGAHVTSDVIADGKGIYIYSNVLNGTTTSEYWDGIRMWKTGAILGIISKGITILSGTGKLDYFASGAHVTGDVIADGEGGFIYSNVSSGTTTSEYWDGISMWKAGAIIGVTDKGKGIGVVDGLLK